MVSRYISELGSVKPARAVEDGPCCATSLVEDVIPIYHVSAGVSTASDGTGV